MSNDSGAKKTGRPKTDTEAVNVRMSRDMLDALDGLIAEAPDPKPSRPDIIRSACRDWLVGKGRLRQHKDAKRAN